MKYALLLLFCSLIGYRVFGNAIDSIKTKEDVRKFLTANFGTEFEHFRLFRDDSALLRIDLNWPKQRQDAVRIDYELKFRSNNFYKVDINNDGKTDLIFDAGNLFVFIDKGNGYVPIFLDSNWPALEYYCFKEAIKLYDNTTVILLKHYSRGVNWPADAINMKIDTLAYPFNGFAAYNRHPSYSHVTKIEFDEQSTECIKCINDHMEINKDGKTEYHKFDTEPEYFIADSLELNELWHFLEYLDVKSLNDNYAAQESDAPNGILTIYFDEGTVKQISDYGLSGTFGLRSLYQKLFALQHTTIKQLWYGPH